MWKPVFELKENMLVCNLVLAIAYCMGVIAGLNSHERTESEENGIADLNLSALIFVKELTEILILAGLYINVRPRLWPELFVLDMRED